jgi:hypothetical protein
MTAISPANILTPIFHPDFNEVAAWHGPSEVQDARLMPDATFWYL